MKHLRKTLSIFFITFLLSSSFAQDDFLIKADKFFQSKRYKGALKEINYICSRNSELRADTASLGTELRAVRADYAGLEKKYEEYMGKSEQQLARLNSDLKARLKELEGNEKLLQEREQRLKEMEAMLAKQDSLARALNEKVKNAFLGFKPDELSVEMRNGKVYVSMTDKLLFKSGSAAVEEKGRQALKQLAEVLNKNPDIDIAIEGHTDNVPIKTAQYKDNWDLSVARATSIVRILSEEHSLEPKRLTASGKGEYFPAASNETAEGRLRNRRTEIILSPKLDELLNMLQRGMAGS